MKNKLLASLLLLVSSFAMASPITMDILSAPQGLTIQNQAATFTLPTNGVIEQILTQTGAQSVKNKTFDETTNTVKQARAIYDFTASGGLANTNYNLSMGIPQWAIITEIWVDVLVKPTSGGSPTIGISGNSGSDLLADTAIASLTVGLTRGKSNLNGGTSALVRLTQATGVTVNLKAADLTAGKFAVFINYMISSNPNN